MRLSNQCAAAAVVSAFAAAAFSMPAHAAQNGDQFKAQCDKTPHCSYRTTDSGAVVGGYTDGKGHTHLVDCPAGQTCTWIFRKGGQTKHAGGVEAATAKIPGSPAGMRGPGNTTSSNMLGASPLRSGSGLESHGLATSGSSLNSGGKLGVSGASRLR
jgi:hypothetical protein